MREERGCAMFDSPFDFCNVCRGYVLLDQTVRQCAREHGCGAEATCSLAKYFTGFDFGAKARATQQPSPRKRRPAPGAAAH
jgi:hypothetical protein